MALIDLAEAFKRARITSRLTQREVANATGVGLLTISKFERGALTEIGAVKLLALLQKVGLELQARPVGHQRTLDDVRLELDATGRSEADPHFRKRVRHTSKKPSHD